MLNLQELGRVNTPAKQLETVNINEIFGHYDIKSFEFFTPEDSTKEKVFLNYPNGHVSITISPKIAAMVADGTPTQRLATLIKNYPDVYVSRESADSSIKFEKPVLTFSRKGVLPNNAIPFTSIADLLANGSKADSKKLV